METFSFLKNDYPDLYLLCSDVAKYIDGDKSISMLKARQAIEYIVKYLGAEADDLFVNINNLEDKNIANSRIVDLFHLIRKKANKSVHNAMDADTEGVLDALTEICVWLAVGHDKKSISIIKFTDKEKFFLKKYGTYGVETVEEELDEVDTINPLEVVGKFSVEDIETTDVLEQDVFETYEEYCERIRSLPPVKIGYAFLDQSQIDDYSGIAFPLFHVSKHPKIESAPVSAFYVSDIGRGKSIDGIIKAKLKIFKGKIYYDYNSVTLQDDDNEIALFPISWDKYGYETKKQFTERINALPLLPMGIAKPIRKEYDLKNQVLPFEAIPMAYVSNLFKQKRFLCKLNRDDAKEVCSVKSNYKVYAKFKDSQNLYHLHIINQELNIVLINEDNNTIKKALTVFNFTRQQAEQNEATKKIEVSYSHSDIVKKQQLHIKKGSEQRTFEQKKSLAEQGVAKAQYDLALCYFSAKGVEEDEYKALEWCKKAAEQGLVDAQYKLAHWYRQGIGTAEDFQKAFEWCKKAAEQGLVDAQMDLAYWYHCGSGTEKDEKKELEWYLKAAEQGSLYADFIVAWHYELGIGTEKNYNKAVEYYRKAAKKGDSSATDKLKLLGEDVFDSSGLSNIELKEILSYNDLHALKELIADANSGNPKAMYNLGHVFEFGEYSQPINKEKACGWYKRASLKGYKVANYRLQVLRKEIINNNNNAGQESNIQRALKTDDGSYTASQLYDMAWRYETGNGVKGDIKKAKILYSKAAKKGHCNAKARLNYLNSIYKEPLEKNYEELMESVSNNSNKGASYYNEIGVEYLSQNKKEELGNEKFSVVVIGEFSRGKSTFINALLGRALLPTGKQPTTNIISKIIYDKLPTYTIYYRNGLVKHISEEEYLGINAQDKSSDFSYSEKIKSYFKEVEDFSKIKYAEVTCPSSFCQKNVEIVDTPGTNDLNVGHVEITHDYLNKADAVILLLGANQVLSKSEIEFLRERVLSNQIQKIFIVINYKDMLDGPKQEREVRKYVLEHLSDLGDFSKRIFLVSSRQALLYRRKERGEMLRAKMLLMLPDTFEETGFPEFEKELFNFINAKRLGKGC